jgi:hypothetical protein
MQVNGTCSLDAEALKVPRVDRQTVNGDPDWLAIIPAVGGRHRSAAAAAGKKERKNNGGRNTLVR